MPISIGGPFGNFRARIPTPGDVVRGGVGAVGNLVEGVIESVSGEQVELTPGIGVDNTTVSGPGGTTNVRLGDKFASHEDLERLRGQVQTSLKSLQRDVLRLRLENQALKSGGSMDPLLAASMMGGGGQLSPEMAMYYGAQQDSQSNNPMMMLLLMMMLMGQGGGAPSSGGIGNKMMPLLLLMMLGGSGGGLQIGQIGYQPILLDMSQLVMLYLMYQLFTGMGG